MRFIAFEVERQARGYARKALERRIEIEIADAFAEHLDLSRRQHVLKPRLRIDDVIGSLTVVVSSSFLEPDQWLLDAFASLERFGNPEGDRRPSPAYAEIWPDRACRCR